MIDVAATVDKLLGNAQKLVDEGQCDSFTENSYIFPSIIFLKQLKQTLQNGSEM